MTRTSSKRKRGGGAILAEFTSLDALLDDDAAAQRKKQARERKLQKLRAEADASLNGGSDDPLLPAGASPLVKLMSAMESNMTSLSADDYLFERAEAVVNQEKFGYVFAPMTDPLPYKRYEATSTELASDLSAVYKAMEAAEDSELGALLWHKAILLRCVLGAKQEQKQKQKQGSTDASAPVLLPAKICSWLFTTSAWVFADALGRL